jgi:general stress protein 26
MVSPCLGQAIQIPRDVLELPINRWRINQYWSYQCEAYKERGKSNVQPVSLQVQAEKQLIKQLEKSG